MRSAIWSTAKPIPRTAPRTSPLSIQNSLSDFGYAFGQFMDHDLDNSPDGGAEDDIAVAAGDPIGPSTPFHAARKPTQPPARSRAIRAQQVTEVTSYFDLSQMCMAQARSLPMRKLRTFKGGLLKTSPGNMLPYLTTRLTSPRRIDYRFEHGQRRARKSPKASSSPPAMCAQMKMSS